MFTLSFRTGKNGEIINGEKPSLNEEFISDPYKRYQHRSQTGESFTDFLSLTEPDTSHPYFIVDPDITDRFSVDSFFITELHQYADLCIEDPAFFTESCLMFLIQCLGLSIPAMHYEMRPKKGHEEDDIGGYCPVPAATAFERMMRGFLAGASIVYDAPFAVYDCEGAEDACIASLHFMVSHKLALRKCGNCGKYFVAYNRPDAVYCDRISPFNESRTCKEDGPLRAYAASMSSDALKRKIRNTTVALRMRVRRDPGNPKHQEYFSRWMDDLAGWKKKYKNGDVTTEQFIKWLDSSLK